MVSIGGVAWFIVQDGEAFTWRETQEQAEGLANTLRRANHTKVYVVPCRLVPEKTPGELPVIPPPALPNSNL